MAQHSCNGRGVSIQGAGVARASRPLWHGHPARAFPTAGAERSGDSRRDARATTAPKILRLTAKKVLSSCARHAHESVHWPQSRRSREGTVGARRRLALTTVIPAKAGTQFAPTWTTAHRHAQGRLCAGVTSAMSFITMGGPRGPWTLRMA